MAYTALSKKEWIDTYILAAHGGPMFHYEFGNHVRREDICGPLLSGEIVLTKEDLRMIEDYDYVLDGLIDVYVLLVSIGIFKARDSPILYQCAVDYYIRVSEMGYRNYTRVCKEIETHLLASSGRLLRRYLKMIPKIVHRKAERSPQFYRIFLESVPPLLETEAAKELSWDSKERLDKLRLLYQTLLGADHPLTKTLVQRWLPDLKELYATEKAVQKLKMNCCKEELMMNRWHPDRVWKHLEMGIEIEDM